MLCIAVGGWSCLSGSLESIVAVDYGAWKQLQPVHVYKVSERWVFLHEANTWAYLIPVAEEEPLAQPERLVTVSGGMFWMQETDREGRPVGSSRITAVEDFAISRTEVTWAAWQLVRGWAVAHGYDLEGVGAACGDEFPVHSVNWYDAVKWCNARSEKEGLRPVYRTSASGAVYRSGQLDLSSLDVDWLGDGYRLPTEAEWEFAASGGLESLGNSYSGSARPDDVAWSWENTAGMGCALLAGHGPQPVALKEPNELGLYDMSGNLWEWVWDRHAPLPAEAAINPRGPEEGDLRVVRGESWGGNAANARTSTRASGQPHERNYLTGLRVVRRSAD